MLAPGKTYVNDTITININFQNDAGTDVDPTTVTFKTRSPCGVETSYVYGTDAEITKSSVGDYTATIIPTEPGRWYFRWVSTGTGTARIVAGNFLVQDSPFFTTWPLWDYWSS